VVHGLLEGHRQLRHRLKCIVVARDTLTGCCAGLRALGPTGPAARFHHKDPRQQYPRACAESSADYNRTLVCVTNGSGSPTRSGETIAFQEAANLDETEIGDTLLGRTGRADPRDSARRAGRPPDHDTCTQQQQALHEGSVEDDDTLVCAAYAAKFDLTTGQSVGIPDVAPVPVYVCKKRSWSTWTGS
jgi:hypothetical protein